MAWDLWLVVVLILAASFVANRLTLWCMKRFEGEPVDMQETLQASSESLSHINLNEVLHAWGKEQWEADFSMAAEVHPEICSYLKKYEAIGRLEFFVVLDRNLAKSPYAENTQFVQIGLEGDGSPILACRNTEDPSIYIDDVEECLPGNPIPFARNIEDYIRYMWHLDHFES